MNNVVIVTNKKENNILHQHDKGQVIQFEAPLEDGVHILMSNSASSIAKRKIVENNQVQIPDELLLIPGNLVVCIVVVDDNSETTQQIAKIPILHRKEGEEGIAPENQQTFIEQMQDIMNDTKAIAEEVKEAADNGEFNYVLTEEDKKEIADMIPSGGSDVDLSAYYTSKEVDILLESKRTKYEGSGSPSGSPSNYPNITVGDIYYDKSNGKMYYLQGKSTDKYGNVLNLSWGEFVLSNAMLSYYTKLETDEMLSSYDNSEVVDEKISTAIEEALNNIPIAEGSEF